MSTAVASAGRSGSPAGSAARTSAPRWRAARLSACAIRRSIACGSSSPAKNFSHGAGTPAAVRPTTGIADGARPPSADFHALPIGNDFSTCAKIARSAAAAALGEAGERAEAGDRPRGAPRAGGSACAGASRRFDASPCTAGSLGAAGGAPRAWANRARISSAGCDRLLSAPSGGRSGKQAPSPVRSHFKSAPVISAARARRAAGGSRPFS